MSPWKDLWLVVLVSGLGLVEGFSRVDPLVLTKKGLIKGIRSEHGHSIFYGIPYGVVDKNNRFGPSKPHPGFNGTFEAYNSKICPQTDGKTVVGTIDCLTLNIYVPLTASSRNRLPVMVWIHGGAFIMGSVENHTKNPLSFMKNGVIVVFIGYRLGVYGFMCLDHPTVSGNQGLKDQVLALKWINENIEAFGGDNNQITIFGNSAGGMSVNLHLLTANERLFQRAIIQSGPASSPWLLTETNNTVPLTLAEGLGFNTTDIGEALAFLSTVDSEKLIQLAYDLNISKSQTGLPQPITRPCIEKKFEGVETFLTENPNNIKSKKASTVPVIIGYNSDEMGYQYGNANAEYFSTYKFTNLVNIVFNFKDESEAENDIKQFYIGDEKVIINQKVNITSFASDFVFNHPTERMVQQLLKSGSKKIYRYMFSYLGGRNVYNKNSTGNGAFHSDDLGYLFDGDIVASAPEDQLVADRITTLWANFAKYGDPTPKTSELLPVKWQPVTKTTQPYLDINSELKLKARPFNDRMAFWDLFYKYYGKYQK